MSLERVRPCSLTASLALNGFVPFVNIFFVGFDDENGLRGCRKLCEN